MNKSLEREMEVWQCLEVLRKSEKNRLFRKQKNLDEKLVALDQFSKIGYPSLINNLIPLIRSKNEEIRKATMRTVEILFGKLEGKNNYYDSLKHSSINKNDISYFKSKFDVDKFSLMMKIASLNRNGRIREKALKELGELKVEGVLPFVIFRLADWVPTVRRIAKEVLRKFIISEFHLELLNNLLLLDWLRKVERTNLQDIYNEIIDFLIVEKREDTFNVFYSIQDKERRMLAKELCNVIQSSKEVNKLLEDKHFLIRALALDHFEILTEKQKEKLLNDKSARVRQGALNRIKTEDNFEELLENYLADRSGSIRQFSRYYLKGKGINFKAFYVNNLIREKQLIGSLLGLLEIEAKDCEDLIEPYLKNDNIRIVKTAFYVLSNMKTNVAYVFAKANLFTDKVGLRNQIIVYFGKNRSQKILEIARDHYQQAGEEMKLSILKLFSQDGGYSVLADLLIGTIDDSRLIRNQSNIYVQKWKNEAIRAFHIPKEDEKERVLEVFNLVKNVYNNKQFLNSDPTIGLEFYL